MSAGCCAAAVIAAPAPAASGSRRAQRVSPRSRSAALQSSPLRWASTSGAAASRVHGALPRGPGVARAAGEGLDDAAPASDTEAVINAVDKVSKVVGKDFGSLGRNLVLGADDSDESWRALDEKVNTYPFEREFKAIGTGGDDFVVAMMAAAASVTGEVLARDKVVVRESRTAKYLAVNLYIRVHSGEQVVAIFQAMQADKRMRFFL